MTNKDWYLILQNEIKNEIGAHNTNKQMKIKIEQCIRIRTNRSYYRNKIKIRKRKNYNTKLNAINQKVSKENNKQQSCYKPNDLTSNTTEYAKRTKRSQW